MFYLTGTNANYGGVVIDNSATVTLSAQPSGTYQGVLFFQDRSITTSNVETFTGGATMKLTGSLYFPTTQVQYTNGASGVTFATAIVAYKVLFTSSAAYIKTRQHRNILRYVYRICGSCAVNPLRRPRGFRPGELCLAGLSPRADVLEPRPGDSPPPC